MCEPTFEEWFERLAGELSRLDATPIDFDDAYDRYLPVFEMGVCGGSFAHSIAGPLAGDIVREASA